MKLRLPLLLVLLVMIAAVAGCGRTARPVSSPAAGQSTQSVFDAVSPSVVAILNDDSAVRDEEANQAMKEIGREAHAPKKVIDVSLRKEPMPHGTGFVVEGGTIVTAAHVIQSPEHPSGSATTIASRSRAPTSVSTRTSPVATTS